jgi:hypothetical protein
MANVDNSTLDTKHLLTALINLLHRTIVDANRTQAKKIFASLVDKRVVGLVRLKMDSGNTLDTEVSLSAEEFVGDLKFGIFRNALSAWMANAIDVCKRDGELPIMFNEQRSETLFNIPGAVVSEGQLNVMFMSIFQPAPGRLRMKLMFVDPRQFKRADDHDASAE